MTREVSITTYISSKKQDIKKINNEYSFQVLPFWMEWDGKKGEINCIKVKNDNVRYDREKVPEGYPENIDEYRKHALEASQTWPNDHITIFFGEGVARAKIEGSTLIIDGSHWVGWGNAICLDFFELTGIEELIEGAGNKLVLKIKERKMINNHKNFAPTITSLLINFGDKKAERDQYKANLQIGKKYYFNGDNLKNTRFLAGKRLDINNSVNEIPDIRLFNEEGEIITHDFPHKNTSLIKEKILRNLDKICLDPIGYLADAEIIKGSEVEENYNGGKVNNSGWNAWNDKVHQVEVGGEKINLTKLSRADKLAVRKAIIASIKTNPQDWKIEKSNIYDIPIQGIPDSFKVLRHKSGYRHWNVGIIYFNESLEKGKQDWAEIKALINGSSKPVKNQKNDWEDEIKKYFREHNIHSITLVGNNLLIEYNNKKQKEKEANNPQLQLIKGIVSQLKDHTLSFSQPQPKTPQSNSPSQSNPNKNNHQLVIGLFCGATAVILVGVIFYFLGKKKKRK
ncbi:MAG: hypothetical protein I3273_04460 [Candidatus Moeniiplasma glomeromycotorum]|nr:hypothetical protein [Candidatus Moeniiplasma glomeromycotorum]MCE8167828.1 hypothetical protein [Candidatus Moeniiplasma glomeromycotorum]MCE8169347.1 hypothetical protein [Candidatus Moeniiplasma glomeromycotorum]